MSIYNPTKEFIEEFRREYSDDFWEFHLMQSELLQPGEFEPWNKGVKTNGFVLNGATEAAKIKNTGKSQSSSHIKKRSAAKQREIEIEGILYASGKEAAESLGFKPSTISTWVKKNGSRYGISIPVGSNQWTSELRRGYN